MIGNVGIGIQDISKLVEDVKQNSLGFSYEEMETFLSCNLNSKFCTRLYYRELYKDLVIEKQARYYMIEHTFVISHDAIGCFLRIYRFVPATTFA